MSVAKGSKISRKLAVVPPVDGVGVLASKYEVLFDQGSDAIVLIRSDFTIDAMNHSAEELTGFVKAEIEGSSIEALIPVGRIPERSRSLATAMLGAPGTYEDIAVSQKDGYVRLVDLSVRVVSQGDDQLAVAIFRDVTEKKRMERELITKHTELRNAYFELEKKNAEMQSMQQTLVQAGKMAALGELAAGIAHEINQPLLGIRGFAQELEAVAKLEPEQQGWLKEIIGSVDKMAAIISYLRTFTRKSTEGFEHVEVHAPIEDSLKMLSRQFASRGIEVKRDFQAGDAKVYCNPVQLEQIFINLSTNARDAIEATGKGKGQVSISTRAGKDFVEIEYRDNGVGMNEQTRKKIFNPFFTTKDVGKGMGLGLSLSYGMIEKLHGSVLVESELGKGTVFKIRLPRDFRELA